MLHILYLTICIQCVGKYVDTNEIASSHLTKMTASIVEGRAEK
jgi:hypothetical protein